MESSQKIQDSLQKSLTDFSNIKIEIKDPRFTSLMIRNFVYAKTFGAPNCAQAVLIHYQQDFNITDLEVDAFKKCGCGRASKNVCGGIYAALSLIRDPVKQELMKTEFIAEAKSIHCKEIQKIGAFTCDDCVRKGIELVKKYK